MRIEKLAVGPVQTICCIADDGADHGVAELRRKFTDETNGGGREICLGFTTEAVIGGCLS